MSYSTKIAKYITLFRAEPEDGSIKEPKHVADKRELSFNCNYLRESCVRLCNYAYCVDSAGFNFNCG
jgi:hypothetical protein